MADSDTGGRFRNRPLNRTCKGRTGDRSHPKQAEFHPTHGIPHKREPAPGLGEELFENDLARPRKTNLNGTGRSEEHTSELQSLMRISYAVFCLKKKTTRINK